MNYNYRSNTQLLCWLRQCPFVHFHLFLLLLVHPVELVLHGLLPHLALNQHLVGRHPDQVPGLPVPGPGDPEEVVIHVDKVKGEQPEEESTDPAGELEELQGHGVVVVVLHLHLGKGHVDDGFEGELAGVGPAATEEEEGAEDSEDNTEEDVEEVEPHVDGEEAAVLANLVASLLSLCLGGDVHLVGQLVLVLLVAADGLELGVVVVVDRFSRSCQGRLSLDMARLDLWMVAEAMKELSGIYLLHGICR